VLVDRYQAEFKIQGKVQRRDTMFVFAFHEYNTFLFFFFSARANRWISVDAFLAVAAAVLVAARIAMGVHSWQLMDTYNCCCCVCGLIDKF
jgi:hypothetical protein